MSFLSFNATRNISLEPCGGRYLRSCGLGGASRTPNGIEEALFAGNAFKPSKSERVVDAPDVTYDTDDDEAEETEQTAGGLDVSNLFVIGSVSIE